jgi:hypothetical protein
VFHFQRVDDALHGRTRQPGGIGQLAQAQPVRLGAHLAQDRRRPRNYLYSFHQFLHASELYRIVIHFTVPPIDTEDYDTKIYRSPFTLLHHHAGPAVGPAAAGH